MGIMAEVMESTLSAASDVGATRVNTIRLTIGELTGIVPDALEFAFEALSMGTIAEGGTLEITLVPARSLCLSCGKEFDHDAWDRSCPACGAFLCQVIAGDELVISGADVDVPDPEPARDPAPDAAADPAGDPAPE
jgi:hydrogenase nickel incorporation protein HypA/HybF